jgi:hypothetical protein
MHDLDNMDGYCKKQIVSILIKFSTGGKYVLRKHLGVGGKHSFGEIE